MPTFTVTGTVTCFIRHKVDVPQEDLDKCLEHGTDIQDLIFDRAYDDFSGVGGYCGNGGTDKLVGVYGPNSSIEASEEFEFDSIEELEG